MDRIHVVIRVRPLNAREQGSTAAWETDTNRVDSRLGQGAFTFDRVYGEKEESKDIYDGAAADLVRSSMEGMNGTIFAYGQTSSGKTWTMKGNEEHPGLIPLAIEHIFRFIENTPDRNFLLRVSYMEIYNEVISDLLTADSTNLKIHEDLERGVFVGKLKEEFVTSPEQVMRLMAAGETRRHIGLTRMNDNSSRSHTVFRMIIESSDKSSDKSSESAVRVSLLNLVDLAGSERATHTGAEGMRLKEGAHINKSLLTLQLVIAKLTESQAGGHIPYRDSKLTRILQPALGGNSRTTIICTITPSAIHAEESLSTLKFANSAKNIQTKPKVNEVITEKALLKRVMAENEILQQELAQLRLRAKEQADAMAASASSAESPEEAKMEKLEARSLELSKFTNCIVSAKSIKKTKAKSTRRQTSWAPALTSRMIGEESSVLSPLAPSSVTRMSEEMGSGLSVDSLLGHGFSITTPSRPSRLSRSSRASTEFQDSPLNSSVESRSSKIDALQSKILQLESDLANYEATQSRVVQLESELATVQATAEEKIAQLGQKLTASHSEMEAQFQGRITQALGEAEQRHGAIQAELEEKLKTEAELNQQERTEFLQTIVDTEDKLASQTTALEEAEEALREKQDREDDILNQLAKQEEELKQIHSAAELLKASLEASHSKAKLAEEEATRCKKEMAASQDLLKKQQDELSEAQLKIEKLQWDLEIKDNEVKEIAVESAELQTVKTTILELTDKNIALVAEVVDAKKAHEEVLALNAELSAKLAELQAQFDTTQEAHQSLTETNRGLNDQLATLAAALSDSNTLFEQTIAESKATGAQMEEVQSEKQALEAELQAKAQELDELKASAAAYDAQKVLNLTNDAERIRKELAQTLKQNQELKATNQTLREELAQNRSACDSVAAEEKKNSKLLLDRQNSDLDKQRAVEKIQDEMRKHQAHFGEEREAFQRTLDAQASTLKSLQTTNAQLTTELASAKQKEEAGRTEIEALQKRVKDLHTEVSQANSTQVATDRTGESNRKVMGQLEQKASLMEQMKDKLERQLKESEDQKKKLEGRVYTIERENQTLEESERKSKADLKRLRDEFDQVDSALRRERGDKGSELEEKDLELKKLRLENEKLDREVTNFAMQMDTLKQAEAEKRCAEQAQKHAEWELSAAQTEVQTLQAQVKSIKQKYEGDLDKARTELTTLKKDAKATSNAKGVIEKERASMNKQLEQMQAKVTAAEDKAKKSSADKSALVQEKATMERELSSLRSEKATMDKQLAKVDSSLKANDQRVKELTAANTALEKRQADLTKALEKANIQAEMATIDSVKYKGEADASRAAFEKVKGALDVANGEILTLQALNDQHQAQITETTQSLIASESNAAVLKAAVEQISHDLASCRTLLAATQKELSESRALTQELTAVRGDLEKKLAQVSQDLAQARQAIAELQEAIAQVKVSLQTKEEDYKGLESAKDALQSELVEFSFKEESWRSTDEQNKAQLEQISTNKAQLEQQLAKKVAQVEALTQKLTGEQQTNAATSTQLSKTQGEFSKLQTEYSVAQQRLAATSEAIQALEVSSAEMKQSLATQLAQTTEKSRQFEEIAVAAQKELETLSESYLAEQRAKAHLARELDSFREAAEEAVKFNEQLAAQNETLLGQKQRLAQQEEVLSQEKSRLERDLVTIASALQTEQQRTTELIQTIDGAAEEMKRLESELRASEDRNRSDHEEFQARLVQCEVEHEDKLRALQQHLTQTQTSFAQQSTEAKAAYEHRLAEAKAAYEHHSADVKASYEQQLGQARQSAELRFAEQRKALEAEAIAKIKTIEQLATDRVLIAEQKARREIESAKLAEAEKSTRSKAIEAEAIAKITALDQQASAQINALLEEKQALEHKLTEEKKAVEQKLADAEECAAHYKGQVDDFEQMFQEQDKRIESFDAVREELTKVQKQLQENVQKVMKYKLYCQKQQKEFSSTEETLRREIEDLKSKNSKLILIAKQGHTRTSSSQALASADNKENPK